jgi:hypothetical protein
MEELLYTNPNAFWKLAQELGIDNPEISFALEQAEIKMDGSGLEDFESAYLQDF